MPCICCHYWTVTVQSKTGDVLIPEFSFATVSSLSAESAFAGLKIGLHGSAKQMAEYTDKLSAADTVILTRRLNDSTLLESWRVSEVKVEEIRTAVLMDDTERGNTLSFDIKGHFKAMALD